MIDTIRPRTLFLRTLFLLLLLEFALLAGCASTNKQATTYKRYSANQYLQMANNATGINQQGYFIQAANQLINEKQRRRAQDVLNQIDEPLPPHLRLKKQLVAAKLLMAYHQNDKALSALQAINNDHSSWTREDKIEWHTIAAKANENLGNINASLQEGSNLISLLPRSAQKPQLLAIWNRLENLNPSRLQTLLSRATTSTVKGWLSLAAIIDQSNISPEQLADQLQRWKAQYGQQHPASALLPSRMRQFKNIPTNYPRHIVLLLPLSGRLAKAGNAIRNGFFAAYYKAKGQSPLPPEITLIDTANQNITAAYQEAINKGANFVVGPLTKTNVEKLAKSGQIKLPTLALNTVPNLSNNNLYQFGLSPMDEARQAATKAWDEHHYSALIIAPKNKWGQGIANTFEKTWQSLGGQVVGKLAYTHQNHLSKEIRHLLNIDQAVWNKVALRRLLHERIRYIPRRRKDADIIFLVANPGMARQIKPLLRYFYAGNVPVYSISNIYSGHPNAHRDHDLNGIRFPDMPWVLSARMKPALLNQIRHHVQEIWPQSYTSESKLMALGVDAYHLIPKLNKMAMLPNLGTPAATGTLYLDQDHHIYRKLRWSKMKNGVPHSIQ